MWLLLAIVVGGAASAEVVTVPLLGTFDIRKALPREYDQPSIDIDQFVVRSNSLYFLVGSRFPPGNSGRVLLQTDTRGGFRKATLLTATGNIIGFDVDRLGRLYVARGGSGVDRGLAVYDPQGILVETLALPAGVETFCVVDSTPLIASHDGFLYALSRQGANITSRVGQVHGAHLRLAALPEARFVLLKGVAAELSVGGLSFGLGRFFAPDAPEINNARKAKAYSSLSQGRAVILPNVATSPSGDIYMAVSGHQLAEGAPVLHLDSRGALIRRQRYVLPQSAGEGFMLPSHIGVSEDTVFLASGSLVALYRR